MDTPTSHASSSTRLDLALGAVAAVGVFLAAFPLARQGFSFLDDGVWLVGAEQIKQGATLYRDVFTIYGPGKFVALAAFFVAFGTSATTMALLEAMALGVAAGAGTFAARRLGAGWIALAVPFAVFALGILKLKVVWAAVMTLLWGLGLRGDVGRRRAVLLGAGWATVTWFGLDAAIHAGVVVCGGWILSSVVARRRDPLPWIPFAAGFAGLALVPFVWALVTGTFGDFFWAAVVYPLVHFRAEMSVSLLGTLSNTEELGRPFVTLLTGEAIEAQWPRHEMLRAWGLRTLCAVVFVTPWVAIVAALRRARDPLLLSLGLFAASSLLSLVTRGDEQHLLGAALATSWLLAVAIARTRRVVGLGVAVVGAMALLPSLAENVWLVANDQRAGLQVWDRDRAGFSLAEHRIASLEASFGTLAEEAQVSTIFWPYAPGMNFVFDLPLGSPQITLLGGEVRDETALTDDLRENPPRRMVLIRRFDIGGRGMRELAPGLWHFVRTHYRVADMVTETEDPAWILRPVYEGWSVVRQLPLNKRLPDRIQSTIDAWSPQLGPDTRVAQTFRVGPADLTGLQVQWLTLSVGIEIPVEMILWSVEDGELVEPLKGLRSEVHFTQPQKVSLFSFEPVPGTANREIAVELRIPSDAEWPVHLMWHSHGAQTEKDLYPEGEALVNGAPVDADLYFATY